MPSHALAAHQRQDQGPVHDDLWANQLAARRRRHLDWKIAGQPLALAKTAQ